MNISIAAPIDIDGLEEFLYKNDYDRGAGLGLGGSQVVQICTKLLEKGFNLTVFTLDKSIEKEVIIEGENLRIYVGPYRKSGRERALDFFRLERKYLKNAIYRESPDLVHAHWTYEFALGALSTSIPVLTTIRDWAPRILWEIPSYYRFFRLLMSVWVFLYGKNFTSNSDYIRRQVERWTLRNAPVVPNGLRDEYFFKGGRNPNLESPNLISINNTFGRRKNVKTLLRAFQKIRLGHPKATLRLVGDSFRRGGKAYQWSEVRDLTEGVRFIGGISHEKVIQLLRDSDLLIHPSLEESFGNTLVESMAQKTPVVAGKKSGAVPWVLGHGEAGILTDVRSARCIASSVSEILSSKGKWDCYSEKGYRRASATFRLSDIVDEYINMYSSILDDEN